MIFGDSPLNNDSNSIPNTKEINNKYTNKYIFSNLIPLLINSLCISLRVSVDNKNNKEHDNKEIPNSEKINKIPY